MGERCGTPETSLAPLSRIHYTRVPVGGARDAQRDGYTRNGGAKSIRERIK